MGNINNPGGTHTYGMFTSPVIPADNRGSGETANNQAGGQRAEPIAKNVDFSTGTTSTALNIPNQVMGLLVSGLTFMKISQTLNGQPIFERKSDEGVLFGAGENTPVTERIQYCWCGQGKGRWVLLNDTYFNNGMLECCGGTFDCCAGGDDSGHGRPPQGGRGESRTYAWALEGGTDQLSSMVTIGLKGGEGSADKTITHQVGVQPYYSDRRTHTKNLSPQGPKGEE